MMTPKEIADNKKGKYKELYERILSYTSFLAENTLFKIRFWYWENQKNGPVRCACGCGKIVKFPNKTLYARGCHNKLTEVKEKKIQTTLKNYGVINPSQAQSIKDIKREKSLEKFGTTSPFDQSRVIPIWQEKYGVTNPSQLQWVREKISQSHKKLRANSDVNKRTVHSRHKTQYEELVNNCNWKPLFSEEDYKGCRYEYYRFQCKLCGTERTNNLSMGTAFRCYKCDPKINSGGQSKIERDLIDFCARFGIVEEQSRQIIPPLELDVYMPEFKIAFELHGLYWHTEKYKDKDDHRKKLERCRERGIRLIQIFEDEWRNKKKIVQSKIKHILGRVKKKIYARNCEIREVTSKVASAFLSKYHLQGPCKSSIRYGLFLRERLIAVMTFNMNRKVLGGKEPELVRYCSISSFAVVGGAGKLLKRFLQDYNPVRLYSFCDLRWSNGNLYKSLGFQLKKECRPGYFYVVDSQRINRIQFQKHKLKSKLPLFDESLTEHANMALNGYFRIWDAGQQKWVLEQITK